MNTVYRKRIDNQAAFKAQVFNVFTDACGGTYQEFADTLYGMYTVEDFLYADDANYFAIIRYFQDTVIPHKIAVYQAGLELSRNKKLMHGVNKATFLDNLWIHDMSKFSAIEAWGYIHMKSSNKSLFQKAWHHHKQHNPHHPEYWFTVGKDGNAEVLDMPRIYLVEMIADWIGAGETYGNSIQDWLPSNIERFTFSEPTAKELTGMLQEIGFAASAEGKKITVTTQPA